MKINIFWGDLTDNSAKQKHWQVCAELNAISSRQRSFFSMFKNNIGYCDPITTFTIIEIDNCRGDLPDVSAITTSLAPEATGGCPEHTSTTLYHLSHDYSCCLTTVLSVDRPVVHLLCICNSCRGELSCRKS